MHRRQLLIAAKKKKKRKRKKDCNPVWEPKNSCMHLHCFVGSEAKQIISACRLTVWFAFGVWKAAGDLGQMWKFAWNTRLSTDVFVIVAHWCWVLTDAGRNDHMYSLLQPFIHQWASWSLAARIQDAVRELHKMNETFLLCRLCKQPNLVEWGKCSSFIMRSDFADYFHDNASLFFPFFFLLNHMFLSEINELLWPHMCKVAIFVLPLFNPTRVHLRADYLSPV